MTPAEVKRLDRKKCIIFMEGQRPILDEKALPFHTKEYLHAMELNKQGGYEHPVFTYYDSETMSYHTILCRDRIHILDRKEAEYYLEAAKKDPNIHVFQAKGKEFLYQDWNKAPFPSEQEIEKAFQNIIRNVNREADQTPPEDVLAMKNFISLPYSPAFIRGLHAIPCPYHNYYFFTKEQLEEEQEQFAKGNVRGEVVSRVEEELFELYKDEQLDVKPKQLEMRGGAKYSDAACNLIASIYTDKRDIQYVDVQNNGCISDLPDESAVEVACMITADGPKPLATGEMKPMISGTIHMIKAFERMVVEAAVTGNRDLAVTALNMNPLCPSDHLANIVVDELIEAHKEYLPQFRGK